MIVAFLVGTIVTVVSAIVPAAEGVARPADRRDARCRDRAAAELRPADTIGIAITLGGGALLLFALFGRPHALGIVGLGALAIFIGVFVLGPVFARPISRLIGAPLPGCEGITGTLARRTRSGTRAVPLPPPPRSWSASRSSVSSPSSRRRRKRRSEHLDAQFKDRLHHDERQRLRHGELPPAVAEGIAALPQVGAVTPFATRPGEFGGSAQFLTALDVSGRPALRPGYRAGRSRTSTVDGIAISSKFASDNRWKIGDVLPLTFPNGTATAPSKRSTTAKHGLSATTHLARDLRHELPRRSSTTSVRQAGAGCESAEAGPRSSGSQAVPERRAPGQRRVQADAGSGHQQVLNLFYVLLFLAVIIALIGIANTLALSIYERTRELGLLARGRHEPVPGALHGAMGVGDHRVARHASRARDRLVLRVGGRGGAEGPGHHRVRARAWSSSCSSW